MSDLLSKPGTNLPPEQEAIRAKCFHPSGTFVEFKKEEIEQSIPERFEKVVGKYPDRLAVKLVDRSYTFDELNKAANRVAWAILQPFILMVVFSLFALFITLSSISVIFIT